MLKKTIKYVDFDGNERVEDFYFNLTKAEIVKLELSVDSSFSEMLKRIVESKNNQEIIKQFQRIILMAYGVKEDGGRRFIKNDAVRTEFEQTNAFSELFIELATDEDAAAAFMRGIIPSDLDKVEVASKPSGVVESAPTKVELEGLSREDLLERLRKMDEV